MSENLKRAESLFNRIMNQNGSGNASSSGSTGGSGNGSGSNSSKVGGGSSHISSKNSSRHHNHHNSGDSHNNHSGTGNSSNTHSGNGGNSHGNHHHSNNNNHHHHHKGGYKSYNNNNNNNNNNNSYRSNAPNPNIELPKKDPIKTAEETLSKIPADHHVLPYCWTIWHHSRAKPKQRESEEEQPAEGEASGDSAVAVNSYLQTTNEIEFSRVDNLSETTTNIGSLEQMWACLSSLKKTYELPIGTELLIFKSGVNPVWEDPINTKGGRWVFRFSRRLPNNNSNNNGGNSEPEYVRKKSSLIWERLLLKTMTGSIIPDSTYSEEIQELLLNDISGLVLSVRKDEDIISIWNSNLNFNKKKQQGVNKDVAEDDKTSKKLTSFQARRIICDSILRIIRECKMISRGSDSIDTVDTGSNERVYGVSFEYRLHSDNNPPNSGSSEKHNGGRRYVKSYINKGEQQQNHHSQQQQSQQQEEDNHP